MTDKLVHRVPKGAPTTVALTNQLVIGQQETVARRSPNGGLQPSVLGIVNPVGSREGRTVKKVLRALHRQTVPVETNDEQILEGSICNE